MGIYLRQAFYRLVFPRCGPGASIGFGTVFSHATASVGRNVYVGAYCCLGDITIEDDVVVHVYDVGSGALRFALPSLAADEGAFGHCQGVSLAVSPIGDRFVTQTCDGARVWILDVDELLALARDGLTRSLTAEECRQYLHTDGCQTA